MTAGRELDALIAEKVMGWRYVTFPNGVCPHVKHWHGPNDECLLPHYSASIAAAWMVVDKMRDLGWAVSLHTLGPWIVTFEKEGIRAEGSADTEALAICLAALKAVGYKEEA